MILPHRTFPCLLCLLALALTGCGTIKYERATFEGTQVHNPTLGRGVRYVLPAGYAPLNPWSPVPPKPQNAAFERFLRGVVAANDKTDPDQAFREALLFRHQDRYLVIVHVALNLPYTFNSLPSDQRTRLFPELAALSYRYFKVPQQDFNYTLGTVDRYHAILHPPFRIGIVDASGQNWRGTGYTLMGGVTDVAAVFFFAREEDLPAARAELDALIAGFRYGK